MLVTMILLLLLRLLLLVLVMFKLTISITISIDAINIDAGGAAKLYCTVLDYSLHFAIQYYATIIVYNTTST